MIEIRNAIPADGPRLRRLAQRDSASLPQWPLLVAEQDGEVRAALSLVSGEAIADPFVPTQRLIAALRAYAAAETARSAQRQRQPLVARPAAALAG